ncbi:MAG: hypothetical protein LQ340_005822, partial [Diploschistes diacapsis]
MGGASAQIAFAPNATEAAKHAEDLKLLRFRKVNGNVDEYNVFVTTWLEFGVHEARRRYVEGLMEKYGAAKGELPDPCLPKGLTISTKGDILTPDEIKGKEVYLTGTANFQECLRSTQPLLNKDAPCSDAPCLLDGVHVPAIDFEVNHFVGVSEYWHTTHEIFEFAHKDKSYDWRTYQERVDEFCTTDWAAIASSVAARKWGEKVTETTTAEVCFKASWLINMLHNGIGIPRVGLEGLPDGSTNGTKDVLDSAKSKGYSDPFQAVNKIDGTEVSWTLGKMVLYAASEIAPHKTNTLPVGFGSNKPGVPDDFQFAGIYHPPRPNGTSSAESFLSTLNSSESWHDTLFHGKPLRRVPGFLLFMLMLCIAAFLFCGKGRRTRLFHKLFPSPSPFSKPRPSRRNNRGGGLGLGLFSSAKPSLMSSASMQHSNAMDISQRQSLLESGSLLADPQDFELGSVADSPYPGGDDDLYSDDSGSMRKGRVSGWGTPRLRVGTPKPDGTLAASDGPGHGHLRGSGSGSSASVGGGEGLFIRTD